MRVIPLMLLCFWSGMTLTRANWPDFRGPNQNGHAVSTNLPLQWSETNQVKWKTPIPHKGWSTPVVWGNQVWLTTATESGNEFFAICVDANSGKIVLNERIFECATPEPLGNRLNSYASCSPVIEAGRVYVHFGSYGTACLDTESFKVIWKRDDLPCRHYRGPGSSPVLFNDLLILTMDGVDVQYLVALDKRTGKTMWKTDRTADWNDLEPDGRPRAEGDFRKAYSTPLIVEMRGQKQMLSLGSKAAYSYDPATGREIWKLNHPSFSGAARPVFDGTNAFFSTGHGNGEIICVRSDGQGDITDSHVVWRNNRGFPRMPSPVLANGLLFMVTDSGIASCVDAVTGAQQWQERLGGDYAASVLCAGDRVYFFGQDGKTTVAKAGRSFEVLATSRLSDGFMASPAVAGNALVLRTKTHLYRIAK
jgi:outer membrane protein assembly factor BamB